MEYKISKSIGIDLKMRSFVGVQIEVQEFYKEFRKIVKELNRGLSSGCEALLGL